MKINTKVFATVFLIGILSQPAPMADLDFRNLIEPVKIYLNKQSPAYTAWEDASSMPASLEIKTSGNEIIKSSEVLYVGKQLSKKINLRVIAKSTKEPLLLQPAVINKFTQITANTIERTPLAWTEEKEIVDYKVLAQKLVDDEMQRRSGLNNKLREIPSSRGGSIIVSGGYDLNPIKINDEPSLKLDVSSIDSGPMQKTVSHTKTEKKESKNKSSKIVIAGFTGLSSGAALIDNKHSIYAYHKVDGKIYAQTKVNSGDGSYQLESDVEAGEIMAELVSPSGEVIATGSRPLVLSQRKKDNEYLLNLEMHPVTNALIARVVFGALEPSKIAEDSTLTVNGLDRRLAFNRETKVWSDKSFMAGSELMLKAFHVNHAPTIRFAKVGREQNVKIYPMNYLETLKEIVFGKDNLSKYGTHGAIIGKITSRGFPVAGAQVSILGEDAPPVYYTGYIPDKKITQTSENGSFAFAAVSAEDKIFNIKLGQQNVWPIMIAAYFRTITQLDIEVDMPIETKWHSFDAFSGVPVPTVFSSLGAEYSFATDANGFADKSMAISSGLSYAESDSNADYLSLRLQINQGQSDVEMPQFRTEWLNKLLVDSKTSEDSKKRILIGRVDGDDFDVIVNAEVAKNNIIYFNSSGQKVSRGENEGGFIIIGLENGINTIGILPDKSKQIYTRQVYIDPYATHYVPFNLNY